MRVLHAPQHMFEALEENLATIRRMRPTIAVLTEQDAGRRDSVARVRALVGDRYQVCAAPADSSHSRELIVLLRKAPGRRVEFVDVAQLSPDLGPGIANDRHMVTVRWSGRLIGKVAHVATHWNAAIQNADGTLKEEPRAQHMDKTAAPELESLLEQLAAEGRRVTGDADFNWKDAHDRPRAREWTNAPARLLERAGYRFRSVGLDWVWWSAGLRLKRFTVIPAGTGGNHADHPWLHAHFTLTTKEHR